MQDLYHVSELACCRLARRVYVTHWWIGACKGVNWGTFEKYFVLNKLLTSIFLDISRKNGKSV